MKPEKRKAAVAIMLGGAPSKEEAHAEGESSPFELAMKEFAAAVKADDAKAMAAAFRSAMDLCDTPETDEDDDE